MPQNRTTNNLVKKEFWALVRLYRRLYRRNAFYRRLR